MAAIQGQRLDNFRLTYIRVIVVGPKKLEKTSSNFFGGCLLYYDGSQYIKPLISKHEEFYPIFVYCWSNVVDDGPTINQHWSNVLCLLCPASFQMNCVWPYISPASLHYSSKCEMLTQCWRLWDIIVQLSQQTRYIPAMLVRCWATVCDADPTLYQHCVNVSCLRGRYFEITHGHLCTIFCFLWHVMTIWWQTVLVLFLVTLEPVHHN